MVRPMLIGNVSAATGDRMVSFLHFVYIQTVLTVNLFRTGCYVKDAYWYLPG